MFTQPVKYVEDFIPKLLQPHFGWDIEHPSDNDVLIFKNNFIENNQLECIYYISEFFQKSILFNTTKLKDFI